MMDWTNYEVEGQMDIFDIIGDKKPFKIDKPVRLIELFGGIGSQAMALERLGVNFEHYRLVEFDKYPVASYNAIHGTNFTPMDIREVHGEDLGIVDTMKYCYIMTYSFPCQDLSVAGKGAGMTKGSGTRSGLLWEVERLLNECIELPQVLVMENVTQVHSAKNKDDFQKWLDFLESKGYSSYYQDLNAKDYGVAQSRNRCFCVSLLGNLKYEFPQPIKLKKTMKDYLEDEVDDKYYITSEKAQKLIETLILDGKIFDEAKTPMGFEYMGNLGVGGERGDVFGMDGNCPSESATQHKDPIKVMECKKLDVVEAIHSENIPCQVDKKENGKFGNTKTLRIKNIGTEIAGAVTALYPNHADASDSSNLVLNIRQATKEGSIECHVPGIADLDYPTSQTRRGRVIEGGYLCPTLTTENIPSLIEFGNPEFYHFLYKIDGEWYLIRIRKLTPRECWALMDFNEGAFDRAQEVNSNTQLYKQAGNSIVTNVLVAIFGQMFEGKENYYKDEFSGCMNPPEGE